MSKLGVQISFYSKAVVVLEVCSGSLSCWNTALRPSLRREGIMLCFSMSQCMLAIMVPSMNCSSPVLAALMQPQTMTLPQPLDMTLSTCTQLLWSTMARPVLSGTCPVKPLYGSVSGSWQSSYSLHHLYVEQQFFFSDPQRVLCHEVPC